MRDATKPKSSAPAPEEHVSRIQERSRATRRELVDAAREIFARDGFELARLEDIAASAGKTRGAFYTHFRDKEDAFFAIFEEDLAQDERTIRSALAGARTAGERADALTDVIANLIRDRGRMLLSIEFKLYAIRRPQGQERLAALHAAMCLRCAETHIQVLLPELEHKDPARQREQAAQFAALIDGLALNRLFDPSALNGAQVRSVIRARVELAMAETAGNASEAQ